MNGCWKTEDHSAVVKASLSVCLFVCTLSYHHFTLQHTCRELHIHYPGGIWTLAQTSAAIPLPPQFLLCPSGNNHPSQSHQASVHTGGSLQHVNTWVSIQTLVNGYCLYSQWIYGRGLSTASWSSRVGPQSLARYNPSDGVACWVRMSPRCRLEEGKGGWDRGYR